MMLTCKVQDVSADKRQVSNRVNCLQLLLSKYGLSVSIFFFFLGNTPLHYGACGGFKEVVQELMVNGANVEIHNENGHTPLMEAASAGHVDVAKILLEHGAGINTHSNEFKESALTLACYKGKLLVYSVIKKCSYYRFHFVICQFYSFKGELILIVLCFFLTDLTL